MNENNRTWIIVSSCLAAGAIPVQASWIVDHDLLEQNTAALLTVSPAYFQIFAFSLSIAFALLVMLRKEQRVPSWRNTCISLTLFLCFAVGFLTLRNAISDFCACSGGPMPSCFVPGWYPMAWCSTFTKLPIILGAAPWGGIALSAVWFITALFDKPADNQGSRWRMFLRSRLVSFSAYAVLLAWLVVSFLAVYFNMRWDACWAVPIFLLILFVVLATKKQRDLRHLFFWKGRKR